MLKPKQHKHINFSPIWSVDNLLNRFDTGDGGGSGSGDEEEEEVILEDEDTTESEEEEDETEYSEETTEEEEEEFDEITYNKGIVKVPKSRRTELLQKGYNYDKVTGRLTKAESALQEIADLSGMTIDQVRQSLREQHQAQEITGYAETYEITEEEAKRELERENRLRAVERDNFNRNLDSSISAEMESLKDRPHFNDLKADIEAMVENGKRTGAVVAPSVAYKFILGERFEELSRKKETSTVASAVANMHDKAKRGVIKSDTSYGEEDVDVSTVNKKMASVFGSDPKKIASYVKKHTRRK